jgi:iron complex outermembrane receptor protein
MRPGQINVDMHYIRFTDLINWRPMAGSSIYWIPDNITSANSYGIDCSFRTISIYNTTLGGSYSFLKTENYNDTLDDSNQGKQILYTPMHSAVMSLTMKIKYAQIMYHVKYTGSRLFDYYSPQDLPGYFNSNMSILVPVLENKLSINFMLKIENLMNVQYQTIYGYPDPGRSITLTLTINEFK